MAAPRTTTWPIEPQTSAKHAVLRRYLEAWFPILGSAHTRIVYIDGFAGPGRYNGGEEGSPLIAIRSAMSHSSRLPGLRPVFLFVEEDEARAKHLETVAIPALVPPAGFEIFVLNAPFEDTLTGILDELDKKNAQLAPTLAFIDPFGIKGLPFSLVARLLARTRCEVLITFMTYAVQRFSETIPDHVNSLIGRPDAAELIANAPIRAVRARELYDASLRSVARFVSFFRMLSASESIIYELFFATNSPLGFLKMKEAMWKADPSGGFTFSVGADPDQQTLLGPNPETGFAPALHSQFTGRRVLWDEVEAFAEIHPTYLPTHARGALKLMESDGLGGRYRVVVEEKKQDGSRRRRGTFPRGTVIRFS